MKRRAAQSFPQRLEIADRAIDDLRQIEEHSQSQWGSAKADEYLQLFEDAIDRIRQNPSLLRVERDVSAHYFLYRVHKYWLVCDIIAKTTYLVTILHTSMDVAARLTEWQPLLASEVKTLRSRVTS